MGAPNDKQVLRENDRPGGEGRWVVWRMDDHGSRFEIARFSSREEASDLVKELESRGHKQTYWVAAGQ